MRTTNRLNVFLLFISLTSLQACLPDSFTKFEESAPVETEAPRNSGGTTPTIPGAGTSSCTGTAAECFGPSDVRYEDQVFDLDAPGNGGNFGPQIIGNSVPVEQLNFSLKSVLPAGLGFNPNNGEFFGSPIDYFNDDIEVHITHPNTGKTFVRKFNLQASRQISSIEYHVPVNQKIIVKITNAEEDILQFNSTQSIVTESGTKAKIDYIDPITLEIHATVTKTGPLNIGEAIDNNAFFVAEKTKIEKAVLAIDLQAPGTTTELKLISDPDLSSLTEEEKSQVLAFTTDPTDKVLATDPTGLDTEFFVCDDPDNATCNGDSFGALFLEAGKVQEEKSIMVKVSTLDGVDLNSIITYRVLPFASPKSISKVVYPQKEGQKLVLKIPDEEVLAKFTKGGWVSNERGTFAKIDFISTDSLLVTIGDGDATPPHSTLYFEPGDKLDNEKSFFFEETTLPISETDSSVTYVFPLESGSTDNGNSSSNFFLHPEFYFPDGKTALFEDDTKEESQVRISISPNPSTKEENITYGSNLAGTYTFDFCDINSNGVFNSGVDVKNQPPDSCAGDYIAANTTIFGDNDNADGGIFSFPFCDGNSNRVYDAGADQIDVTRTACIGSGGVWFPAGSLNLAPNTEIETVMEAQTFQVNVKNALGNEHNFLFKLGFDKPPKRLSVNRFVLLPVTKTNNFDVGDYISSSGPTDSNIDCRNSELALSLQNFGGTFSGVTGADGLIGNDDFWNCAVGIVTDVFDSTRTLPSDNTRIYHADAAAQKYIGVQIIKGRFLQGMSIDNVKIFSSEKAKISLAPIPYGLTLIVNSATNINDELDTDSDNIFDQYFVIESADANNNSSGHAIAAFETVAGSNDYKVLIRNTPNVVNSCDNANLSGGNCRYATSSNVNFLDPDTASLEFDATIDFIKSEALFIRGSSNWGVGEELTANPADGNVDNSGGGQVYEDFLIEPMNGVIMDVPDTATPQDFEVFVRKGVVTDNRQISNSNPFNGSKYYFENSSVPNSGDPNDSPFGDPSIGRIDPAVSIDEVKSSNRIYLYKDDPVSIPTHVVDSGEAVFEVTPDLPEGLIIDPATGEIRGAPKGKSDPRVYSITATNPFGSTTSFITIEVVEYFGIDLFANETEPFSYILHKEGQQNEVAKCRVLKNQIDRANSASTFNEARALKKLVDIGCFLEAGERDLYEKGFNVAVRIPNNTCEYVIHEPYQFYAFKPGKTANSEGGGSKVIYNHVSGDKGIFEEDERDVWDLETSNPSAVGNISLIRTVGADRNVFFNDDPVIQGDIEEKFLNDCNAGEPESNSFAGAGTFYPGTNNSINIPNIAGGDTESVEIFEHINGKGVKDIFGNGALETQADATKFLCSFNYSGEDENSPQGPLCDKGSVSIKTVTWSVGGAKCRIGDFEFSPSSLSAGATPLRSPIMDSSLTTGPCKNFDLAGSGLSCIGKAVDGSLDQTCGDNNDTLKSCVYDNNCKVSNGSEDLLIGQPSTGDGNTELRSSCHIPAYVLLSIDNSVEGQNIISCGGKHNNCISGPAVEDEDFTSAGDGQLVSKVLNVVKENGLDSLGGETFSYSPSRSAFLGNGDNVNVSLNREVASNIYLANFISHPEADTFEADGEIDNPNFGALCSFTPPNQNAGQQAVQYDLDTLIRGLGNSAVLDPQAGYYGIGNSDAIVEPLFGSRPYYGYKCVDSADNVVARIRLIVRDWNKTFKPSDYISYVSPDLGQCQDGDAASNDVVPSGAAANCHNGRVKAEQSLMDNPYKTIYDGTLFNKYKDWDDYGFSTNAVGTSCYDLNLTNAANLSIINGGAGGFCFGQCFLDSDGACIAGAGGGGGQGSGGTGALGSQECWERSSANCIANPGDPSTGCVLNNFPAFNY